MPARRATSRCTGRSPRPTPPNVGDLGGQGPGRLLRARRPTGSQPNGNGGTHFEYENEFKAPGGVAGPAASRVLVGGMPEREADKSLKKLKKLLES